MATETKRAYSTPAVRPIDTAEAQAVTNAQVAEMMEMLWADPTTSEWLRWMKSYPKFRLLQIDGRRPHPDVVFASVGEAIDEALWKADVALAYIKPKRSGGGATLILHIERPGQSSGQQTMFFISGLYEPPST